MDIMVEKGAKTRKRKLTVAAARKMLEKQGDVDENTITRLAIHSVEQDGIVFIDEIDKICEKKESFRGFVFHYHYNTPH